MTTPPDLGTITGLRTRIVTATLPRPWSPTRRENHLVIVDVETSSGQRGQGFSWTPTIGVHAVKALLDHDIAEFVIGREADPRTLWPLLWEQLHEAGSGGLTTISMAGLDLALWDALGKRADLGLADLLGRKRSTAPCYGSGVNRHYDRADLLAQVQRWVDAGHTAVKIKVGGHDLARDIDRVGAVREILGPDRRLMIDANQLWDVPTAVKSIAALRQFDLEWVEEPLLADDLAGYTSLRQECGLPIAAGENLHTKYRFLDFIRAEAVDVMQPNVIRVGGITPFLEIADLAADHGLRFAPHLLPDLSGQLALVLPMEVMVENVEDADFGALGVLAVPSPVEFVGDGLRVAGAPGLGLTFHPQDSADQGRQS